MADEPAVADRKSCWIDSEMVNRAKVVAGHTGSTISEVLERLVAAPLAKEYARVVSEMSKATAGA